MSRIIRSTFAQVSEDDVKEIQIREMFIHPLHDLGDDDVSLSMHEVLAERDQILEEARFQIEQERLEWEQFKNNQLAELNDLKVAWEDEKVELQQQAYEDGFAQGFEAGITKANSEMQQSIEMANHTVEDARINAKKYIEDQERVILELAMTAAERIVDVSLEKDEELFISIVRRGLKEAREMNEIKIYVSPMYHALVTKNRDELAEMFPPDVPFLIFVNEDLNSTESYIETNHGRIVVSLDQQLNELRLKLSEILDSKE